MEEKEVLFLYRLEEKFGKVFTITMKELYVNSVTKTELLNKQNLSEILNSEERKNFQKIA